LATIPVGGWISVFFFPISLQLVERVVPARRRERKRRGGRSQFEVSPSLTRATACSGLLPSRETLRSSDSKKWHVKLTSTLLHRLDHRSSRIFVGVGVDVFEEIVDGLVSSSGSLRKAQKPERTVKSAFSPV